MLSLWSHSGMPSPRISASRWRPLRPGSARTSGFSGLTDHSLPSLGRCSSSSCEPSKSGCSVLAYGRIPCSTIAAHCDQSRLWPLRMPNGGSWQQAHGNDPPRVRHFIPVLSGNQERTSPFPDFAHGFNGRFQKIFGKCRICRLAGGRSPLRGRPFR
jgi:hypothetical protein